MSLIDDVGIDFLQDEGRGKSLEMDTRGDLMGMGVEQHDEGQNQGKEQNHGGIVLNYRYILMAIMTRVVYHLFVKCL
jgi:hypothetical protein